MSSSFDYTLKTCSVVLYILQTEIVKLHFFSLFVFDFGPFGQVRHLICDNVVYLNAGLCKNPGFSSKTQPSGFNWFKPGFNPTRRGLWNGHRVGEGLLKPPLIKTLLEALLAQFFA